jgi:CSLREA domain-containing protein
MSRSGHISPAACFLNNVIGLAICLALIAAVRATDVVSGPAEPTALVVNSWADSGNGICSPSFCTLRDAITAANENGPGSDHIGFDPSVFNTPRVIDLQTELPNINSAVTIDGPGADRLTVRRGDNTRSAFPVFSVAQGLPNVSISGMTIANGRAAHGGGIYSQSALTLTGVHVMNNFASQTGGGVFVGHANAVFTNCSFSGNSASDLQGGALALAGEFGDAWRMVSTTISGNFTNGQGGGISVTGFGGEVTLEVINSTIANNSAPVGGGGIAVIGDLSQSSMAKATLRNTIIADNLPNDLRAFGPAAIVSNGFNLTSDDGGGFLNGAGDKVNASARLATLSNYGGTTPTHALHFGSDALDAGNNAGSSTTTDQRGSPRTIDLASVPNAADGTDIGAYESRTSPSSVAFDYDGDRKSDISVFRRSVGNWYVQRSFEGYVEFRFGSGGDMITPADFDGDGKTDIAVFRPFTGTWYILNSRDLTVTARVFGLEDDIPMPADYDGDGKADRAVFRPSTGYWYRRNSSDGSFVGVHFGASDDLPVVGDYDGDGSADIAVFRPSSGVWYQLYSSDRSIHGELWGVGTDVLIPADYDGDGKTDVAVYRAADERWYVKYSSSGFIRTYYFGLPTDIQVPADYDGDGKADICIFRPSTGVWYRLDLFDGSYFVYHFGTNGDEPTQTAFRY